MLQKTSVNFNFGQGLDTLTDPNQVALGKFTDLENSVFVQAEGLGSLEKRTGFDTIASFTGSSYLSTFNGNLLGVGSNILAYSNSITATVGYYQPLHLSTLTLSRNFYPPSVIDSARAENGFVGYVYRDSGNAQYAYYFAVIDGESGQQMLAPIVPTLSGGTQQFPSRVFYLNGRFVVTRDATTGSNSLLEFYTVDSRTLSVSSAGLISGNYRVNSSASVQIAHDGFVANNNLYVSWQGSSTSILASSIIGSNFTTGPIVAIASSSPSANGNIMISVTGDTSSATTIFTTWSTLYRNLTARVVATDQNLARRWEPQTVTCSGGAGIVNIASGAFQGNASLFFELEKNYAYNANAATNLVTSSRVTTQGSLSSQSVLVRSVGLASKAFTIASQICFLSMYSSPFQSTYFLQATSGTSLNTIGKMAYGNAASMATLPSTPNYALNLPNATVLGSSAQIAYLVKTQVQAVNKSLNTGSANASLYYGGADNANTGANVSTWTFDSFKTQGAETANNLHLNGGFLWAYDGMVIAEHNFHLYPDNISVTTTTSSGTGILLGAYFYQVVYEWQDAQGNIHESAPSVPVGVTAAAGGLNTIHIPTLRLTSKPPGFTNPVVVSIYRWSTSQPVFYKLMPSIVMTPVTLAAESIPVLDNIDFAALGGNQIIYTNGGVLENIGLPAVTSLALFDTRLWAISAENDSVLYYGLPGVQAEPAEMSDLQTYFVPPNISGVPVPGGNKCLFAMDDKLIVFKKNAIAYINGTGPDATGTQNNYSKPILITNGVGCDRPNSIVLIPQGLIFQSDNGFWLLSRDMSVKFIGSDVDKFSSCEVKSAVSIPGSTEARLTLGSSGQTLVYDYLVGQWNQQTNVPGIASCIYQGKQTILDSSSQVKLQSSSGFADNGVPTVMKWTTGWINLGGLQGYVRAYRMFILGKFMSPHTYRLDVAYDYNPQIVQTETINPTNTVGSGSQVEQWQINFLQQQCQSFQLTFNEISSGTAGAGLIISGMKLVYGAKADQPRNIGVRNKV